MCVCVGGGVCVCVGVCGIISNQLVLKIESLSLFLACIILHMASSN